MFKIKKRLEFILYYIKKIYQENENAFNLFKKIKNHPLWLELTTIIQLPIIQISIEIWDNLKEISKKKNTTIYKFYSDLFVCFLIFNCFYYFSYLRLFLFSLFLIHITISSLILFYICIKILLNWSYSLNKEILIFNFSSFNILGLIVDTFWRKLILDELIDEMEEYFENHFDYGDETWWECEEILWWEKIVWNIHTIIMFIESYFTYNSARLTIIIFYILKGKSKKTVWSYFAKILIYFFIYLFIYFGEVSLRCLLCILYLVNNLLDSEQLFIDFLVDIKHMWENSIEKFKLLKIFLEFKKIKVIEGEKIWNEHLLYKEIKIEKNYKNIY